MYPLDFYIVLFESRPILSLLTKNKGNGYPITLYVFELLISITDTTYLED